MSCPLVLWAGSLPWASPGSNPGDGRLRFCNLCRGPLCRTPFPASSCLFQLPEASRTPWLVAPSSSCLTASKGELSPSHAASLLPAAAPSSCSVQNPVIALSPPGFSRFTHSKVMGSVTSSTSAALTPLCHVMQHVHGIRTWTSLGREGHDSACNTLMNSATGQHTCTL